VFISQILQTMARAIPNIWLQLGPSTSFQINYLLIVLVCSAQ